MDSVEVVARREPEQDGYAALQLGLGEARPKRMSKGMRDISRRRASHRSARWPSSASMRRILLPWGSKIGPEHFGEGQFVDVAGTSIGKGFAGAIKRHGFSGLRASHGVSISHRSHGSTGQCQDSRTRFQGQEDGGSARGSPRDDPESRDRANDTGAWNHHGQGRRAGSAGGWVEVRDAVKKPIPNLPAFPLPAAAEGDAPEAGSRDRRP